MVPASAHFPVGYNSFCAVNAKRIVPASAHFPVGYNYVVVQLVGGGGNQFIDTQTAGGYERRLQVAVWANERAQAMQISGQIEQKLLELPRVAADSAGTSDYDYEVNLRGMRQDFMFIS